MKKLLLFLLSYFLYLTSAYSQAAPGIEWQNTIGGDSADYLSTVQHGGYILGGFSHSTISGDKAENCEGNYDYWIVKTDSLGSIEWQNTIGGSEIDELNSIQQTSDNGYILGGFSESNISGDKTENSKGDFDYWIVKTDSLGNIQWQKTIGGNNRDQLNSIQQTDDSGFILGGSSMSNISGDKTENSLGDWDYWIIKTDSLGNIQWQNTIGGSNSDLLGSIQQTIDGNFILDGYSNSNISGDKTENCLGDYDYWIVKTDSLGSILWQNTIGGNSADYLSSVEQTSDGGYILGGSSQSNISGDKTENNVGDVDYWLVKTDTAGQIQWQNTIGGNNGDFLIFVQQTTDSGYVLGGHSGSNISGDKTENRIGQVDYWIVKTDSSGNIQWQNTIGGNNYDFLSSIKETNDEGLIIAGYSYSNISGDKTENTLGITDFWVIKLYPDTTTGISNLQTSLNTFQLYPNPLKEEFGVSGLQFPVKIKMFDVFGKEVLSKLITTSSSKLETSSLPAGVYFVKVGSQIKKVIKIN